MQVLEKTEPIVRRVRWEPTDEGRHSLVWKEWLVTNGLGGYSSGTVAGALTRRYHGLLIAALSTPFGRTMMFNHLWETLRWPDGRVVSLNEITTTAEGKEMSSTRYLAGFYLEDGLPVWTYDVDGIRFEKRVLMPYLQNTTHITYQLLSGGPVRLELRPLVAFRLHEAPVSHPVAAPYLVNALGDRFEIVPGGDLPPLRLYVYGEDKAFTLMPEVLGPVAYALELHRGYEACGELWSPGYLRLTLGPDSPGTLVASTESWETIGALDSKELQNAETRRKQRLLETAKRVPPCSIPAELVLAADQFIIEPAGRMEEAARAQAAGDEVRTVIAGYHWFTDWGRDTMISLEGLTLCTGRQREAGYILRTFGHYVRDGLIPNMFPEGTKEGLYHTSDASLWYFHAIHRYLQATGDRSTLHQLLPKLKSIFEHHIKGTRFGIGVDTDGLLRQGAKGYQLTWMDAKVDDWVVTPRRGKAVEINALWYNALRLLGEWLREEGDPLAPEVEEWAARAYEVFNTRFWYKEGGYLYDVIDGEQGDDPACRPNQIFAISLEHPVLDRNRWRPVFEVVRDRLLTPVGLRSLAPGHRDFKAQYYGDLRARDAAYHQGTVWAWLAGPFVDAWLKIDPADKAGARAACLEGFIPHLSDAGIGTLSEVFDAESPYVPRGCIAQAWSVAEVLRAWMLTEERPVAASR